MGHPFEIIAFTGLSLALHVALFGWGAPAGAPPASGDGGESMLTLAAADPSLASLVAQWDADRLAAAEPTSAPQPTVQRPETVAPPPLAAPDLPALAPAPHPASTPDPKPPEPSAKPAAVAEPPPPATPKTDRPNPTEKPTRSAPQAGSVAERAAGQGGGGARGMNGHATDPAAADRGIRQALGAWGATIRTRIERQKRSPKTAQRQRGKVTLSLTVARSGALLAAGIARSSGNPDQDAAALDAVRRAGPFGAAPAELREASYSFRLTISFEQ